MFSMHEYCYTSFGNPGEWTRAKSGVWVGVDLKRPQRHTSSFCNVEQLIINAQFKF